MGSSAASVGITPAEPISVGASCARHSEVCEHGTLPLWSQENGTLITILSLLTLPLPLACLTRSLTVSPSLVVFHDKEQYFDECNRPRYVNSGKLVEWSCATTSGMMCSRGVIGKVCEEFVLNIGLCQLLIVHTRVYCLQCPRAICSGEGWLCPFRPAK